MKLFLILGPRLHATDLCDQNGSDLSVVTDYYSSFIEVERLNTVTSCSVIRELYLLFSGHKIPDVFVSDNEPQFSRCVFIRQ